MSLFDSARHPTSPHPFRNEPARDFSAPAARERMIQALAQARASFPVAIPLVLDGQRIVPPAEGGRGVIVSTNPADTSEALGRCPAATAAQTTEAVVSARRAFPAWSALPARDRVAVLRGAADWMRERRDLLNAMMVLEAGKSWKEADADVTEAIDFLDYYAFEALRLEQPVLLQPDLPGEANAYGYDAAGVAAVISPWNFPLAIPAGMVAAALVAGNTVCFKPSQQTPLMGWMLARSLYESGCPPQALQFLPGRGSEVGTTLIQHPEVDIIAFTGSRDVGFFLLREAAQMRPGQRMIKKVVCELGGKNAIIVDPTADMETAVPAILHSAFGYGGQKCSACSRLIVIGAIHDSLLERLRAAAAANLRVEPPENPDTVMGPVIDAAAKKKIESYIEGGKKTARVVFAGALGDWAEKGTYVAPHIFADVKPEDPLATEEIFGPVLSVLRVKDLDEAIALANATPYALTGGILSRDEAAIDRAAREVRVGNFYINRGITGAKVYRQPFGGFGHSGVGSKAGGPDYLKQFLLPRSWSRNL